MHISFLPRLAYRLLPALICSLLLGNQSTQVLAEDQQAGGYTSEEEQSSDLSVPISSLEDLIYFLSEATATSERGGQFLADLLAWGLNKSKKGTALHALIIAQDDQSNTNLLYRGHSVTAFLTQEAFGPALFPIGTSFNPDTVSFQCSGSEKPALQGICGVLSALHSLKKLGVLDSLDKDQNTEIDRDLLIKAKTATGNPNQCGTTSEEEDEIYRQFSNGKIKCGEETPLSTNGDSNCQQLLKELENNADCRLTIRSSYPGEHGHTMHIKGAGYGEVDGACVVETFDTAKQGDGKGTGVPTNPGRQSWQIHNEPKVGSPAAVYRSGSFPKFFQQYEYPWDRDFTFKCCQ